MAVPKEILAVERPKSTRVKEQNGKYMVIKREYVTVNGIRKQIETGVIGHIENNKFIRKINRINLDKILIKEYAAFKYADRFGEEIYDELTNFYNIDDAKEIYVYALMRVMRGNIPDREIGRFYEDSFMSEKYPSVGVSKNTISKMLQKIGANYHIINDFMKSRFSKIKGSENIIIDGMLKTNTSKTNTFSNFSYKSKTKGEKKINIMFAFNPTTGEPIASKIYPGNMIDNTTLKDFISTFQVKEGVIMGDKGFFTQDNSKQLNNSKISFLLPIKRKAKVIKDLDLYNFENKLNIKEEKILYKTGKLGDTYYYSYKDLNIEGEQKKDKFAYLDKKEFDIEKYKTFEEEAGTIVFASNVKLDPMLVYNMYKRRWEIETFFNYYKNIIELYSTNKHSDISVIGSEFINFLSIIIACKIKKDLRDRHLEDEYSYKWLFKKLVTIAKGNAGDGDWQLLQLTKANAKLLDLLEIV